MAWWLTATLFMKRPGKPCWWSKDLIPQHLIWIFCTPDIRDAKSCGTILGPSKHRRWNGWAGAKMTCMRLPRTNCRRSLEFLECSPNLMRREYYARWRRPPDARELMNH